MKIEVTQEDIENGVCTDICNCPIAIAVRRAFGKASYVNGYMITIGSMFNDGLVKSYMTPQNAADFISDFDNGKEVKPFSFEL